MKTINTNSNEDFDRCPFHSNINAGNDVDINYRRTYNGDWGHWDDAPENELSDQNQQNELEDSDIPAAGICS